MRGVYLYCLTPPGESDGLEIAGVSAGPVSRLTLPWLTAWTEHAVRAPEPTLEAIRRHDEIVRAVCQGREACLPVRFGQWLEDSATLEAKLDERREELERALSLVAGATEHGVRIHETDLPTETEDSPRPAGGRAYMEWLRDRERRREALERRAAEVGASLAATVGETVRDARLAALPGGGALVSVAHLVEAEREAEYRQRVQDFVAAHDELRVLQTGPWPPYSFAP